jgi:phosphoribosylformylglycinamidine synthase subunit PurS
VRYRVELVVSLKDGLLDPQGKAVEGALPSLGWNNVSQVSVGKYIRLSIEAEDEPSARAQVQGMAERFLTNPVIENYRVVAVTSSGGPVEVRS